MATTTATKKAAPKKAAPGSKAKPTTGQAKKAATTKKPASGHEFAVIETGGKQYMVAVGDVIDVELMGDHKEGDKVEFDKVLLVDDGKDATIGTPYISGAKVKATYQKETKGKKLTIIRYKAKSNRDRRVGHRQHYARVQIDSI